jgi:hypothetical protein
MSEKSKEKENGCEIKIKHTIYELSRKSVFKN